MEIIQRAVGPATPILQPPGPRVCVHSPLTASRQPIAVAGCPIWVGRCQSYPRLRLPLLQPKRRFGTPGASLPCVQSGQRGSSGCDRARK